MGRAYVVRMKRALLLALMMFGCGRAAIIDLPDALKPQQQQPLRGCDGQSVIALDGRRTLWRITSSGSTKLFTFGEGLPDDEVSVSQWNVTASGVIGGVAFVGGTTNDYTYELVLIAPDGKVVFTARRKMPHGPSVFLGADGSFAVSERTGYVIRPDGSVTEFGDLQPMTPVLPDGSLVVARGKPWEEATPRGIWKDGAFTPVTLPPYTALQVVGSRAVYVTGTTLASATDALRVTLPLPELQVVAQSSGRFVLLAAGSDEAVVVDLDQATAKRVSNVPTPSQRYGAWNAGLQADGAVLATRTRGEQLQLQRTKDFGASWSDVGTPMAMGEDFGFGRWLSAVEKSGTVLTLSMSTGYGHYVNEVQLTSASGTHRMATGGVYVNGDLSPGAADLSPDGQCAAAWVQTERDSPKQLVFIDVQGKQSVVRESAEPGYFRFVP